MKIIKFLEKNNKFFGIINNDSKVIKLPFKKYVELIENIQNIKNNNYESLDTVNLEDIKILAPVEFPIRNIFCIGKNYIEHAKELEGKTTKEIQGIPENPIYFSKIANPAIGNNGEIKLNKKVTKEVDYEVELGVIIGKEGKNIPKDKVSDYIFGYTIINDVTARDLQRTHIQWLRGKSLDTFCPIGPNIVTKDEIENHGNLRISLKVNGELRQDSNTSQMIFTIEDIISDLSRGMKLIPGDIIATGTPKGVGMGFVPPKYLKAGDEVICEIENIGKMKNVVIE